VNQYMLISLSAVNQHTGHFRSRLDRAPLEFCMPNGQPGFLFEELGDAREPLHCFLDGVSVSAGRLNVKSFACEVFGNLSRLGAQSLKRLQKPRADVSLLGRLRMIVNPFLAGLAGVTGRVGLRYVVAHLDDIARHGLGLAGKIAPPAGEHDLWKLLENALRAAFAFDVRLSESTFWVAMRCSFTRVTVGRSAPRAVNGSPPVDDADGVPMPIVRPAREEAKQNPAVILTYRRRRITIGWRGRLVRSSSR
jgi:hypothetical protein